MTSETWGMTLNIIQAAGLVFAVCHLQWQIVKLKKEKSAEELPGLPQHPPPPRPAPPPPPATCGENAISLGARDAHMLGLLAGRCGMTDGEVQTSNNMSLISYIGARLEALESINHKAERYRRQLLALAGDFLPYSAEVIASMDPAKVGSELRVWVVKKTHESRPHPFPSGCTPKREGTLAERVFAMVGELVERVETAEKGRAGGRFHNAETQNRQAFNLNIQANAAEAETAGILEGFRPWPYGVSERRTTTRPAPDLTRLEESTRHLAKSKEEAQHWLEAYNRALEALWHVYYTMKGKPFSLGMVGSETLEDVRAAMLTMWEDARKLCRRQKRATAALHQVAASYPDYTPQMWEELAEVGTEGEWLIKKHQEYLLSLTAGYERQMFMLRYGFTLTGHAGGYKTLNMFYNGKFQRMWHGFEQDLFPYLDTLVKAEKEGKIIMPIEANEIGD